MCIVYVGEGLRLPGASQAESQAAQRAMLACLSLSSLPSRIDSVSHSSECNSYHHLVALLLSSAVSGLKSTLQAQLRVTERLSEGCT